MPLYNYRFYFPNKVQVIDPEQTTARIEGNLNGIRSLGLVRLAIDLTSQNKSIGLLCNTENSNAVKSTLSHLLSQEGIFFERMEEEELEDEEEMGHEEHVHTTENSGPIKKKKKKIKGSHNHGYKKGHSHNHAHDHSHTHDHSPGQTHAHKHGQTHAHSHGNTHGHGHAHDHEHGDENHWLKAALGLLWGIGLLIIAIGSFNIPMIAYYIITGLTTLMTFYLGYNVYKSTWNSLQEKKWDTTTLYTISTLTIVAVSIASMFIPGLPMMFEAAPLVLGFWHLGEGIEHTLIGEISKKLDVRDCVDPLVLVKGKPNYKIPVKHLIPNDIIIIEPGGVIPVDGELAQEKWVFTTRIDGSPEPKKMKAVKAGMQLEKAEMPLEKESQPVEMRVTKTYQNSYLSILARNIEKANDEKDKAPLELLANKVLQYFIPGLLGIALLSGIIIGCVFNPALAIQCVVSVLVSACPCALSLITPLAVKIGMKKASENGILFKNGKALQAAADIDTVVFDLNGTLTQGKVDVQSLRIDDVKYLDHIALLESQSDHPVAKIIASYIKNKTTTQRKPLVIEAESIDKTHHSGIKGIIDNKMYMIGNKDMLSAYGITHISEPYDNPEKGSIYIVREGKVIGQISLEDPLRPDAPATVLQLQRLGKKVHICTGADKITALKYAKLLNIPESNIFANTVGAITRSDEVSKASYIAQLQHDGHRVAMVGDAANDLEAIAHADVGIGIESNIGDAITQQQAGIVVQEGTLFSIATAFDIAGKTKNNIFQNLCVSLTYNSTITLVAAGLFVAIGFALNPALGVAFMVLESAIVLMNLYRFKQQDIVTSASNEQNTYHEASGQTTSDLLHSLGYFFQPKANLDKDPESPDRSYGDLFESAGSKKSSPSAPPVFNPMGEINQMC